ncbi:MAG: PhnD/SsuA/transferrin family substrate-binding protein [Gammaproteobacteria bacterium]|nr:PhnD/SsuA/transferrin family substrate-binding protein [Gammaproteobacteria bacterium]MDH3534795.1 PhnD/SsuA/transferrin family substrate-binding protein [Gammaproteobacteria bacterium]
MNDERFISCGMYTLSRELKNAWQVLFDRLVAQIDRAAGLSRELVFDASESMLRDRRLFIGHTCGYPLMTRLQDALEPICVPIFDVPGTSGKLYCSQIVVPADSVIDSLDECRGKIVAVNNADSNSGMNLLRHALAELGAEAPFFSEVLVTGGHAQSLESVAANRAQLAAIDCVSYQLIADRDPALIGAVRVIGHSAHTCGLPFVVPRDRYSTQQRDDLVAALNHALADTPIDVTQKLHLARFEPVTFDDYRAIVELERFAIDAGYPLLK